MDCGHLNGHGISSVFCCKNYSKMLAGILFGLNPLIGWLGRGKLFGDVGKLAKFSGMSLSICAKLLGMWLMGMVRPRSLPAMEGGVKLWR